MKKNMFGKIVALMIGFLLLVSSASALTVDVSNYDPVPANINEFVNVWFKVQTGARDDNPHDVYIEVVPQDGLELTTGEEARKYIGTVTDVHVVKYRFRVKEDALEGPNLIKVRLIEGEASTIVDTFIEVKNNEADLEIGDIESDPTRIKPDDDNVKLDVTLLNIGEAVAESVRVNLEELPEGVTLSESYSGSSLLGSIDSDSQADASFLIDVDEDVKPGEHIARLNVKYKTEAGAGGGKNFDINLPLRLAIYPVPLYEISDVSFTPQQIRAGDKSVVMKLGIKNVGEETGESIRVKAFAKTEQPFTFDVSSDFVSPELEPGERAEASLEFDIDDDANLQTYSLDLEIKNVVENDVLTYQKTVPIDVVLPKEENPWQLPMVVGGVIFVVVIFLLVRYIRKRGKKAKAKKVSHHYGESYLDQVAKSKKKKK